MTIASFISNLASSFGKKDVREKLRIITSKINEVVIPTFETTVEEGVYKQHVSSYGKSFDAAFRQFLPSNMRGHPQAYPLVMRSACDNSVKLLDLIADYIGDQLGESVHVEGLTYQKASVLRLIEFADFFADYSIRHMACLVASETNITAFQKPDGKAFTNSESEYLRIHLMAYFRVLELFANDPKKAMATVGKIPEVLLSGTEEKEVPALAGASADPLHLNLIPGVSSIFHWIGIRLVDWEIERYERAKKEKRDVEMRLEALRQKNAGRVDAHTETVINNYERELTLLRSKISVMEERSR